MIILKGAILQKQNMYYTFMDKIFTGLNNIELEYNWLIPDYECNDYPHELIPFNKEYVWISGEELNRIVYENKIQFIWGVFSAFEKDIKIEDALNYPLPYADGNSSFGVMILTFRIHLLR